MLFEQAFSSFLDRREYDQAENALFSMVRIAFCAGWIAAGGRSPDPQPIIRLMHKNIHGIENTIDTEIQVEENFD